MKDPVFVSYYWGPARYNDFATRWKDSCKAAGVQCYAERMQQFAKPGMYQLGINHKPKFILNMLDKFPKRPVVYTDIDVVLHKPPVLFRDARNIDMMCLNWNHDPAIVTNGCVDPLILETSGPVFYFNNTPEARRVLKLWHNALKLPQYSRCADDRVLAMVFHAHRLLLSTRVQWLPIEYLYFPQFFKNSQTDANVVIEHPEPMTTEELAASLGSAENRIPEDYRVQYSVRDKTKRLTLNRGTEPAPLEKRLRRVGFKFNTTYTLPRGEVKCTTRGVKRFPMDVTPRELIEFWESEGSRCDIVVGKYTRRNGLDFATDALDAQSGTLKFKNATKGIYLRKTDGVYTLLKHWETLDRGRCKGLGALERAFNTNASHRMKLRCGNM